MFLIGEQCPHIGNCLFLTSNTRDSDLIQRYWISEISTVSSDDDEGLPEP